MPRDNDQNIFRRGVLAMVILALLSKEDMYGYQLVLETERITDNRIQTQEGSLYPVLYKLQEQGFVSDYRKLVGKRMTRVYYHLEPSGQERLAKYLSEYKKIADGVRMILEFSGISETI